MRATGRRAKSGSWPGPYWGRDTAATHGQPRCPADNQTDSSSAVIGRDGAAGPYMACKGSARVSRGASVGADGGSLVAVAVQLDPAALMGAGRAVGVVDHRASRVGLKLPMDDHGAPDRDGHTRRQGQVVVDLDHDTLAQVDAEALVGAVGAVAVGEQPDDGALDGHLRSPAAVEVGDERLVVRLGGVAAAQQCRNGE